jgi:hypothetical protein
VTEPNPIISRAAAAAKTIVDESADVLREDSKKVDGDKFEVQDVIATATKLLNVGFAGVTEFGRIALEERPSATTMAIGEYVTTVVRRMITQAGSVAQAASMDVDNKDFSSKTWLESMTRMVDIAIAGGMEIAETIAAGPAQFERPPARSDTFTAPAKNENRVLSFETPLKREATEDIVSPDRISFEPPTLAANETEFCVLVDPNGLASGVYRGTVKSGNDSVPVYIAL